MSEIRKNSQIIININQIKQTIQVKSINKLN